MKLFCTCSPQTAQTYNMAPTWSRVTFIKMRTILRTSTSTGGDGFSFPSHQFSESGSARTSPNSHPPPQLHTQHMVRSNVMIYQTHIHYVLSGSLQIKFCFQTRPWKSWPLHYFSIKAGHWRFLWKTTF